ncbi:MAG: threonine synthase [Clostridia bacterium]|nr:threonine synthase [Clostridia bacterium]
MKYVSTRDKNARGVSSAEAIKTGLAPDGGLFMPESIPSLTEDDFRSLAVLDYPGRAAFILSLFLDDYGIGRLDGYARESYREERFPGGAAPLRKVSDGLFSLELWHGPTCAFKDMALQIMPRLLSGALTMTGERRTAHILVATSGDTGKAALEGYRDVPGVKITVFYPRDGVSRMQKMQMTTQEGGNVNVTAVEGNFDDAQTGVKRIFSDGAMRERADRDGTFFSSANSINWGRLAPQIVYYVSAYCDLMNGGAIKYGDTVNYVVPTGNFGNIFAAFIAKKMGLPVGRLICASNSNRVLTDFIETGVYDRNREFFKTISPSMDILISSNLERLIFSVAGAETTASLMDELGRTGRYKVPADVLAAVRETFSGYSADENETRDEIGKLFREDGYLVDPHTAVGFRCAEKYFADTGDGTVTVVASTASPYKFPADVCAALGDPVGSDDPAEALNALSAATGTDIPAPLARVLTLPVRFTGSVSPDKMEDAIFG